MDGLPLHLEGGRIESNNNTVERLIWHSALPRKNNPFASPDHRSIFAPLIEIANQRIDTLDTDPLI